MKSKAPGVIPRGLLGMLFLVTAVEVWMAGHLGSSGRFEASWVWDEAGRQAREGSEILCFGDSQIKNTVLPAVIEAETGRKTYNLAQNGSQIPASYFLLRRSLARGANPKAVVVGFNPALLSRGCDFRSACWLGLAGPWDWLDLAWSKQVPEAAIQSAMAIVFPSIRDRAEIRAEILGCWKGEENAPGSGFSRDFLNGFQRRNWTVNRGAQVLPDYNVPRDPRLWYQVDYPRRWSCDPTMARYLDRFLSLAESRGILVYWLLHPVDPEGQALIDKDGQEDRFGRFLAEALRRHRNLVLIDGHHSGYDRSAFVDMVHLHDRGAYSLSVSLARILRDHPSAATRQLTLPAYQARPLQSPIEDLNRSMAFIREHEKETRLR